MKVLRCCDRCDIVGVIKGEKKFKGAHWHCYKCRNGFNRRDEAIKHYKTHFRNPHTTFQIQIVQVTVKDLSIYMLNIYCEYVSFKFLLQSLNPLSLFRTRYIYFGIKVITVKLHRKWTPITFIANLALSLTTT